MSNGEQGMYRRRIMVLCIVAIVVAAYILLDLGRLVSLGYLQSQMVMLQAFARENLLAAAGVYLGSFIGLSALSVPGAGLLSLLGGAVFGFGWGVTLTVIASTIGCILAFLSSRLLLRDWVQRYFARSLKVVNRGIRRDGALYLFTLRTVPIFPFFLVNLLMGLTPISLARYSLVSLVGMVPGTMVYIYAGRELGRIDSLSGLLSPSLLLSLALLGLFPWITRGLIRQYVRLRAR